MDCSLLDEVSYHTIQKFDLIRDYVVGWSEKIMHFNPTEYNCKGIIYIDCMCNCGEYINKKNGEIIDGTSLKVIEKLIIVAHQCVNKSIEIYFNDISAERVNYLKNRIEKRFKIPTNMNIYYSSEDASRFLEKFHRNTIKNKNTLLVYDPYEANIDWKAIDLFLNSWGEVIINHMISDAVRGVKQAKNPEKKKKYETTYQVEFEKLLNANKKDYELLVEKNIRNCIKRDKEVFISSIPFYIKTNVQIYNLIHISYNIKGFNLFKTCAWKIANGQSSIKYQKKNLHQLTLDLGESFDDVSYEYNYTLQDIVFYIKRKYGTRGIVALNEVYKDLQHHPIFPCDGFKNDIKNMLKMNGCEIKGKNIIFKEE